MCHPLSPECSDIIPQTIQLTVDTNMNRNLSQVQAILVLKVSTSKEKCDIFQIGASWLGMVTPNIPLLLLLCLPTLHHVACLWNVKSLS